MTNEVANAIAPVVISLVFMSIPLVVILSRHQQKMFALMRQPLPAKETGEMDALREALQQQAIAIDNLARSQAQLAQTIAESQSARH